MKTTLNIQWQAAGGNNGTTNITYVNPNATNEQLREFGEMLNKLTSNTLRAINRTDVTEITGASYEYSASVNDPNVNVTIAGQSGTTEINSTIPDSLFVDWTTSKSGDLAGAVTSVSVDRAGSTTDFDVDIRIDKTKATKGATGTLVLTPSNQNKQIANSIILTITAVD